GWAGLSTETRATEELGRLETVASPVASPLVPVRLHIITHPSLNAPRAYRLTI
ncbi:hypothetical protein FIBSPDRAFT_879680, partial [Athelia psychrophila]